MRKMALLLSFNLACAIPAVALEPVAPNAIRANFDFESGCDIGATAPTLQRYEIQKNFNAQCLSAEDTQVVIDVTLGTDGCPKFKFLHYRNAIDADQFYCEQAIWATAPLPKEIGSEQMICKFDRNHSGAKTHELSRPHEANILLMHFVPESASILHPYDVTSQFIHAPANVVELEFARRGDPRLMEFRKEWVAFLIAQPLLTKAQLDPQVLKMKAKYFDLFVK